MRTPPITHIDTALRIFYENTELGNKEIATLFGKTSSSTLVKLKRVAQDKMIENGISTCQKFTVNTRIAFEAWGINVDDLEKRRGRLIKLGLYTPITAE